MSMSRQLRRAEARAAVKEARKQERLQQQTGIDLVAHDRIAAEMDRGLEEVERLLAIQDQKLDIQERKLGMQGARPSVGSAIPGGSLPFQAGSPRCSEQVSPNTAPSRIDRTGIGGPKTQAGRAKSSLNNLKHGLTGSFRVMEFESQSQYDDLVQSLEAEHKPEGATEELLVRKMAEHLWLSRRAQIMLDGSFIDGNEREISLHMRYGVTHDRAFSRCLNDLLKLRREKRVTIKEFESQKAKAAETEARVRLANARATALELDNERKKQRQQPPQSLPAVAKATENELGITEMEVPAAA